MQRSLQSSLFESTLETTWQLPVENATRDSVPCGNRVATAAHSSFDSHAKKNGMSNKVGGHCIRIATARVEALAAWHPQSQEKMSAL
jgi:hypothetical protein